MKWSKPQSRLGWWAFSLGLASLAWFALTPLLRDLLGAALAAATLHPLLIPMAYALAIIDLVLALAALVVGIIALAKGDRSRMVLVAFLPLTLRVVLAAVTLLALGFPAIGR